MYTLSILLAAFLVHTSHGTRDGFIGFSEIDGALYTPDAVIIQAATISRSKRDIVNNTRDARQILLLQAPEVEVTQNGIGSECFTSTGDYGVCKKYRECVESIPADQTSYVNYAQLEVCYGVRDADVKIFGVCCPEAAKTERNPDSHVSKLSPAVPVALPPLQIPSFRNQLFSAFGPQWVYGDGFRQIPAQWPPTHPPLPTHPPDHTAPTHPPFLVPGAPATSSTTRRPVPTRPPQMTTWPTRKPVTSPTTSQTPAATTQCGMKNNRPGYSYQDEQRIVGGHNADVNEWPWIVALFNQGRQFCGGSLIDSKHVISAAHCVAHMTSYDVAQLTARLGDHNIRTYGETPHVERRIKRVVRHRGFSMKTLLNDVSLLTLDQPVQFSSIIRPICLPSSAQSYAGVIGTVIGWGSLQEGGYQPSVLQEVSIPIWNNQDCRARYGAAAPAGIAEHMMCAGNPGMDSCSGDSGGPLMVSEGGRWVQVGIVSWGIGCGKGAYPGVYSRVTSFLPWIQKNRV